MLAEALTLDGPSIIRFPKTPAPGWPPGAVGSGLDARRRPGRRRLGVHPGRGQDGRPRPRRPPASSTAEGIDATVWDVRVVSDPDPAMLADAARHRVVITAEDGVRQGGAGMFLADALRAAVPAGRGAPGHLARDPPGLHRPGQARPHPGPSWAWTGPGWPGRSATALGRGSARPDRPSRRHRRRRPTVAGTGRRHPRSVHGSTIDPAGHPDRHRSGPAPTRIASRSGRCRAACRPNQKRVLLTGR